MKTPPTHIVFDLGGVVLRICRTWEDGCRAAGIDVRGDLDEVCAGEPFRHLNRSFQSGDISSAAFNEGLAGMSSGQYTAAEIARVNDAWILGEYPGVTTVLTQLKSAGVTIAVFSNTNSVHWARMPRWAVMESFPRLFASQEIGAVKPDEAAYVHVETELGVGAESILFFDDLIENVNAACERGWDAVQIDHTGDTAAQMRRALRSRGLVIDV